MNFPLSLIILFSSKVFSRMLNQISGLENKNFGILILGQFRPCSAAIHSDSSRVPICVDSWEAGSPICYLGISREGIFEAYSLEIFCRNRYSQNN